MKVSQEYVKKGTIAFLIKDFIFKEEEIRQVSKLSINLELNTRLYKRQLIHRKSLYNLS